MLNWLRELLGVPRPVHTNFDRAAIALAKPGDVLVFTSSVRWSPEVVESLRKHFIPRLEREAPGVAICINSAEWQATVVPGTPFIEREAP